MALRPRGADRPLFTERWAAGLAPVAEAGMVAQIEVYQIVGEGQYDLETDSWTVETEEFYDGKARVQPVRSSREVQNTGDPTMVQRVRFQIPRGDYGLLPDQRVRVTSSPLNPALERSEFVIVEITDSSNPFETTFEATTNLEVTQ